MHSQYWPTQYGWPPWRKTMHLCIPQPACMCWEMAEWVGGWRVPIRSRYCVVLCMHYRVLFPWPSYHVKTLFSLLTRTLRLRNIRSLAQDHTANKQWDLTSNVEAAFLPFRLKYLPQLLLFSQTWCDSILQPAQFLCLTDFLPRPHSQLIPLPNPKTEKSSDNTHNVLVTS